MEEIRWGAFRLDRARRVFARGGEEIRVQPLTFQLLELLAVRLDHAVSREEIAAGLWPGVRVVDDAITQVVRRARIALGDDPLRPACLLTVPRYGYRLAGLPVEAPAASLTGQAQGQGGQAQGQGGQVQPGSGQPGQAKPGSGQPGHPDGLIGRREELDWLRGRLRAGARCLCLLGDGGLGKTRLLRALAEGGGGEGAGEDRAGEGADPGRLDRIVDLSRAVREEDLLQAVSEALGIAGSPDPGAWSERIGFALRVRAGAAQGAGFRVGLDNLEQLPAAGDHIARWLAAAPGLQVALTSRRDPGVEGAEILQLQGLPAPEARELFARRLGRPPTDGLIRLLDGLDGWPLAVELAAGRARWMDEAALAAQRDRPLRLLARGARPGDNPRHDSLRASLRWSHDLLSPAARLAWAALSPWAGGFSLSAALRLGEELPAPGFGPDALEELVGIDLLRPVAGYSATHPHGPQNETGPAGALRLGEAGRAFGLESLAELPAADAIRAAWRRHVLSRPDEADTADLLQISRDPAADRPAAIRALHLLWSRLNGQSGMYVLGPVADALADAPDPDPVALIVQMGIARDRDPARCERLARQILSSDAGEEHLSAAHTTLALLLYQRGRPDEAAPHAEHGLALAPLPAHRVSAAVMVGLCRSVRDPAAGLAALLSAEAEAARQPRLLAMLLIAASRVRGRMDDLSGAEADLRRALRALGPDPGITGAHGPIVAGILCNLGVLLEARDPQAAADAFASALAVFRAEGDRRGEANALTGCAEVLIASDPARARPLLVEALALAGELRLPPLRSRVAAHLERLAREAGDPAAAEGYRIQT